MKELIFKDIADDYIRENFTRVQKYLNEDNFAKCQWKHFEVIFPGATTNRMIAHRLGFQPLDLVQTFKTGVGTVTFNYDDFSDTSISITASGACRVRFFLGRYNVEL